MKGKPFFSPLGLVFISLLGVGIFFSHLFFTSSSPFYFDFFFYVYPHFKTASDILWQGEIPFWNPYLKGGVPFWSDPAIALVYPLHILFLLFPFSLGLKIFLALHYGIAFLGAYYCARQYRISREGSLFMAITFTFSGYMVGIFNIFTKFRALVWIPFVFGLLKKGRNTGNVKYFILASLAFSMVILAGHLYAAYFCLLFLCLEIFLERGKKKKKIPVLKLIFFLSLSLGFSAPLWLPTLFFLQDSERKEGLSLKERKKWHTPPGRFLEFGIHPGSRSRMITEEWALNRQKKHWINSIYLGCLAFLLFGLGFFHKKTPLFCKILVPLSFLFAMGDYTPFWILESRLPLMNRFRYPEKFLFWTTFGMAFLSAYGFDLLFLRENKEGKKIQKKSLFLLAILISFLIYLFFFHSTPWLIILPVLVLFVLSLLSFQSYSLIGAFLLLLHFGDLYFANSMEIPLAHSKVYSTCPKTLKPLFSLGQIPVSVYPYSGESLYQPQSLLTKWKKEIKKPLSSSSLSTWLNTRLVEERKLRWIGNTTMIFGKENPVGYSNSTLWRYNQVFLNLYKSPKDFFDFFGTEYLLTYNPPPDWVQGAYTPFKVFPKDGLLLLKRKNPLPFCQIYDHFTIVKSFKEGLSKIKKREWRRRIVLEIPTVEEGIQRSLFRKNQGNILLTKSNQVRIISKKNHSISLFLKVYSPAFLLVRTSYAHGWRAWKIQKNLEEEIPIYPGNHLFLALPLEKGEYKLLLEYIPPGFYISWILCGLTGLGLGVFLFLKKRKIF
ncbi:MAG: DUF2079 domain-containing protein [Planctomycetota bacterium]|nr:MAG: DUF2079 domain-containing protein [Planctomycetota bacterium]